MRRLIGMALAMLTTGACASEISVAPFNGDPNGEIIAITLTGEILPGDNLKFEKAFWRAVRKGKGVILELHSSGGDTWSSEGIALFIRKQGIATLVRGDCTSGCGIIALSARTLWVAADGRIGLHQAWIENKNGVAIGQMEATRGAAAFLRPYGVPESALRRMLSSGPYSMGFVTDDELVSMGAHINRNVLRASQ